MRYCEEREGGREHSTSGALLPFNLLDSVAEVRLIEFSSGLTGLLLLHALRERSK